MKLSFEEVQSKLEEENNTIVSYNEALELGLEVGRFMSYETLEGNPAIRDNKEEINIYFHEGSPSGSDNWMYDISGIPLDMEEKDTIIRVAILGVEYLVI